MTPPSASNFVITTMSCSSQRPRAGLSVRDFSTLQDLRSALLENMAASSSKRPPEESDWMLPVPDEEAMPESVDVEIQRLLTLKSYLVLDVEQEEALDQLTREACQYFQLPISLISLVDFGRQYFISSNGAHTKETSRRNAMCSHAIINQHGICVVPDIMLDPRFANSMMNTDEPKLRCYAGAPLVSPEGYNLGTFCVEGPIPRQFSEQDKIKLKEYAQQTMALLVERRKNLHKKQDFDNISRELRQHAALCTNLGSYLYLYRDNVTAMKLLQESVQTLMYVDEGSNVGFAPKERRDEIAIILQEISRKHLTQNDIHRLVARTASLYPLNQSTVSTCLVSANEQKKPCILYGIPGLFGRPSKLIGVGYRSLESLIFSEAFRISLEDITMHPVHERKFIIPIEECSKATLFNMGLIHYHWGSPSTALQFFDLASSLSQQLAPLDFDPVVISCLNNMAQIHLQFGRAEDAAKLLEDAFARGNAALSAMYGVNAGNAHNRVGGQAEEIQRTRRLRRKLARTVLNMGHVHFYKCDYDEALVSCRDSMRLLHTNMEDSEVAAVWFNIGVLHYNKGNKIDAIGYLDKFMERARQLVGSEHLQLGDALHRKGQIMFEMGDLYGGMKPLTEALYIRCRHLGDTHVVVAESLALIGRVLLEREEFEFAIRTLERGLTIHRKIAGTQGLPFEAAQCMLDLGRALHFLGHLKDSLSIYSEVRLIACNFFGPRHPFVARIDNIIGNVHLELGEIDAALDEFANSARIHIEKNIALEFSLVKDPFHHVKLYLHKIAGAA